MATAPQGQICLLWSVKLNLMTNSLGSGQSDGAGQPPPATFRERRERLLESLDAAGLRFLLVTKPVDTYYLTGFRGSAGMLLVGRRRTRLWVDPRYTLQAGAQTAGIEVIETREGLGRTVAAWLRKSRPKAVGYQDLHLVCAEFAAIRHDAGRKAGIRWQSAGAMLDSLRMVKDAWEIGRIRRAGKLTADVFTEVLPMVRPGACESELAAELEYRMKRAGADGAAFETIVVSGPRGAWPHARASCRRLRSGELVIVDLGAILSAYAADMTRTVYLGRPSKRARHLYESVAEAQQEAVENLRPGLTGNDADAAARRALARRKLDQYFTHSTGHGVGLEVHERPRLGRGDQTPLPAGCVVTVEPGLYVEGYGGVRIEDTVLVGENGPEIVTPASKESWFTG
ncbi:MAG TPA: Xaa-Pro peptidase family protein [Terriglobia bacterium]|nr:Xaa-Pro peptidase family protein [Terriglobia bacterium]